MNILRVTNVREQRPNRLFVERRDYALMDNPVVEPTSCSRKSFQCEPGAMLSHTSHPRRLLALRQFEFVRCTSANLDATACSHAGFHTPDSNTHGCQRTVIYEKQMPNTMENSHHSHRIPGSRHGHHRCHQSSFFAPPPTDPLL